MLVKRIAAFAALMVTLGCDPAVTIRQTVSNAEANSILSLRVKSRNQFIGETHYGPTVELTNESSSTATIVRAELIAKGRTIQNTPRFSAGAKQIGAHKMEMVGFWFDLPDNVLQTFREPAQLTIYYRMDGKQQTATTCIVNGPLQTESH